MDDLAAVAGVSRVTLYRVFGSREALLQALADEHGVAVPEPPDTRERVLGAAKEVFLEVGIAQATVEQVAARAGVSPVTVYRHFGDRKGLFTAYIESRGPRSARREILDGLPFEEAVERFCGRLGAAMYDNRALVPVMLGARMRDPELVASLAAGPAGARLALTRLIERAQAEGRVIDGDPAELALMLGGAVIAVCAVAPLTGLHELADPEATGRLAARAFLRGILK